MGANSLNQNGEEVEFLHPNIYSRLASERIIFISQEIDGVLATEKSATLLWLDKVDPNKEITIYINSIGGSVTDGLLTIYDTMQVIKAPVKTVCIGEAYSSAAILLASGSQGLRFAFPNARIMIHGIQVDDVSGTQKGIEDELKKVKSLNQSLMEILARHTGQRLNKVKKDCIEDKYFSSKEAIKYGLIDGIIGGSKHIPKR